MYKLKFKNMNNYLKFSIIGIIVLIIFVGIGYLATKPKSSVSDSSSNEIISKNGLHWHSNLSIYVKGTEQDLPKNIGIGALHMPLHTHEKDGVIHMEFAGLVRKRDLTLGKFFKTWGKDFYNFGKTAAMTVNGQPNTEFENYVMKDNDRIELRYE